MIDPILRASLEVQPFARGVVGCASRDVAFVRVEDEISGGVGFGECAPLAGLHRETRDEALEAIEEWLDGVREIDALPPAAAFAVSCAVETSEGLGRSSVADAEVAAFVEGGAIDDAGLERLQGVRSVKLKVGRAGEAEDRALLARVLEALPGARLRLDGNRRMAFGDCVELLRGFEPSRFEYLEEPVADPSELADLSRATGIPVALDELVADASPAARALRAELARSGRVCAWVLRMSAIGRLDAIARRKPLGSARRSCFRLRTRAPTRCALPCTSRRRSRMHAARMGSAQPTSCCRIPALPRQCAMARLRACLSLRHSKRLGRERRGHRDRRCRAWRRPNAGVRARMVARRARASALPHACRKGA